MKKFLQACELGGSLYGKRRASLRERSGKERPEKDGLADSYTKFYKDQASTMSKMFGRNK